MSKKHILLTILLILLFVTLIQGKTMIAQIPSDFVNTFNLSNFIPFSGASQNVDLNDKYLTNVEKLIIGTKALLHAFRINGSNSQGINMSSTGDINMSGDLRVKGIITGDGSELTGIPFSTDLKWAIDGISIINQTNFLKVSLRWINDSIDNRTASTTYYPTSFHTRFGTESGGNSVGNLSFYDSKTFDVDEISGSNPLLVYINFSGVTSFDELLVRERYKGGLGHEVEIRLWNFVDSVWDNYFEITDQLSLIQLPAIPVLDSAEHISNGVVRLAFNHTSIPGNIQHKLFIDYVQLVDGTSTLTSIEHDSLSGRDSVTNHPWALPKTGLNNTWLFTNIKNQTIIRAYNTSWINNNIIDVWVNESGDTITGYLDIEGKLTGTTASLSSNFNVTGESRMGVVNATDNVVAEKNLTVKDTIVLGDNSVMKIFSNGDVSIT